MNTTRRGFYRMMATTKNQVLYARNQAVWDEDGEPLAKVGQPVLFLPNENLSIDATDLPNYEEFTLAVVIKDKRGNKKLVAVDGSDWSLCADNFKVTHSLPVCPCPQKYDTFFRCVKPWAGYSIAVRARTPLTQAQGGGIGDMEWQFNWAKGYKNWDCTNCNNPSISAFEVACGLAKEVNNYHKVKHMEQVGNVNTGEQVFMPLKAVALPYGNSFFTATLTPLSTDCGRCSTLSGLISLVYTSTYNVENPTVVTLDLTRFNDGGETDPKIILTKVYEFLERELEKKNVFIHVSGGSGGVCCPFMFELGGCVTTAKFVIDVDGVPTDVVFTPTNPWNIESDDTFKFTSTKTCQACTSPTSTYYPEALIRWYPDNIINECGCFDLPGHNMIFNNQYNQIVEVHALEGFDPDQFGSRSTLEQIYAEGNGYYILQRLHDQSVGGLGANIFQGGGFYGEYPEQMFNHKFYEGQYNITCKDDYCSINMVTRKGQTGNPTQNAIGHTMESESLLLIPNTDIDTYDSLRPVFDYLASLNRCNKIVGGCFVLPTLFVINQAAQDLEEGQTLQLTLTVTPVGASEAGVWSSSHPDRVSVSATGLATGGAVAGAATITFTPSHGTAVPVTVVLTATS